MKTYIDTIFDAAESAGCRITEIETKASFSKVKLERDGFTFEHTVDHRDDFTKISMQISEHFYIVKGTYLANNKLN